MASQATIVPVEQTRGTAAEEAECRLNCQTLVHSVVSDNGVCTVGEKTVHQQVISAVSHMQTDSNRCEKVLKCAVNGSEEPVVEGANVSDDVARSVDTNRQTEGEVKADLIITGDEKNTHTTSCVDGETNQVSGKNGNTTTGQVVQANGTQTPVDIVYQDAFDQVVVDPVQKETSGCALVAGEKECEPPDRPPGKKKLSHAEIREQVMSRLAKLKGIIKTHGRHMVATGQVGTLETVKNMLIAEKEYLDRMVARRRARTPEQEQTVRTVQSEESNSDTDCSATREDQECTENLSTPTDSSSVDNGKRDSESSLGDASAGTTTVEASLLEDLLEDCAVNRHGNWETQSESGASYEADASVCSDEEETVETVEDLTGQQPVPEDGTAVTDTVVSGSADIVEMQPLGEGSVTQELLEGSVQATVPDKEETVEAIEMAVFKVGLKELVQAQKANDKFIQQMVDTQGAINKARELTKEVATKNAKAKTAKRTYDHPLSKHDVWWVNVEHVTPWKVQLIPGLCPVVYNVEDPTRLPTKYEWQNAVNPAHQGTAWNYYCSNAIVHYIANRFKSSPTQWVDRIIDLARAGVDLSEWTITDLISRPQHSFELGAVADVNYTSYEDDYEKTAWTEVIGTLDQPKVSASWVVEKVGRFYVDFVAMECEYTFIEYCNNTAPWYATKTSYNFIRQLSAYCKKDYRQAEDYVDCVKRILTKNPTWTLSSFDEFREIALFHRRPKGQVVAEEANEAADAQELLETKRHYRTGLAFPLLTKQEERVKEEGLFQYKRTKKITIAEAIRRSAGVEDVLDKERIIYRAEREKDPSVAGACRRILLLKGDDISGHEWLRQTREAVLNVQKVREVMLQRLITEGALSAHQDGCQLVYTVKKVDVRVDRYRCAVVSQSGTPVSAGDVLLSDGETQTWARDITILLDDEPIYNMSALEAFLTLVNASVSGHDQLTKAAGYYSAACLMPQGDFDLFARTDLEETSICKSLLTKEHIQLFGEYAALLSVGMTVSDAVTAIGKYTLEWIKKEDRPTQGLMNYFTLAYVLDVLVRYISGTNCEPAIGTKALGYTGYVPVYELGQRSPFAEVLTATVTKHLAARQQCVRRPIIAKRTEEYLIEVESCKSNAPVCGTTTLTRKSPQEKTENAIEAIISHNTTLIAQIYEERKNLGTIQDILNDNPKLSELMKVRDEAKEDLYKTLAQTGMEAVELTDEELRKLVSAKNQEYKRAYDAYVRAANHFDYIKEQADTYVSIKCSIGAPEQLREQNSLLRKAKPLLTGALDCGNRDAGSLAEYVKKAYAANLKMVDDNVTQIGKLMEQVRDLKDKTTSATLLKKVEGLRVENEKLETYDWGTLMQGFPGIVYKGYPTLHMARAPGPLAPPTVQVWLRRLRSEDDVEDTEGTKRSYKAARNGNCSDTYKVSFIKMLVDDKAEDVIDNTTRWYGDCAMAAIEYEDELDQGTGRIIDYLPPLGSSDSTARRLKYLRYDATTKVGVMLGIQNYECLKRELSDWLSEVGSQTGVENIGKYLPNALNKDRVQVTFENCYKVILVDGAPVYHPNVVTPAFWTSDILSDLNDYYACLRMARPTFAKVKGDRRIIPVSDYIIERGDEAYILARGDLPFKQLKGSVIRFRNQKYVKYVKGERFYPVDEYRYGNVMQFYKDRLAGHTVLPLEEAVYYTPSDWRDPEWTRIHEKAEKALYAGLETRYLGKHKAFQNVKKAKPAAVGIFPNSAFAFAMTGQLYFRPPKGDNIMTVEAYAPGDVNSMLGKYYIETYMGDSGRKLEDLRDLRRGIWARFRKYIEVSLAELGDDTEEAQELAIGPIVKKIMASVPAGLKNLTGGKLDTVDFTRNRIKCKTPFDQMLSLLELMAWTGVDLNCYLKHVGHSRSEILKAQLVEKTKDIGYNEDDEVVFDEYPMIGGRVVFVADAARKNVHDEMEARTEASRIKAGLPHKKRYTARKENRLKSKKATFIVSWRPEGDGDGKPPNLAQVRKDAKRADDFLALYKEAVDPDTRKDYKRRYREKMETFCERRMKFFTHVYKEAPIDYLISKAVMKYLTAGERSLVQSECLSETKVKEELAVMKRINKKDDYIGLLVGAEEKFDKKFKAKPIDARTLRDIDEHLTPLVDDLFALLGSDITNIPLLDQYLTPAQLDQIDPDHAVNKTVPMSAMARAIHLHRGLTSSMLAGRIKKGHFNADNPPRNLTMEFFCGLAYADKCKVAPDERKRTKEQGVLDIDPREPKLIPMPKQQLRRMKPAKPNQFVQDDSAKLAVFEQMLAAGTDETGDQVCVAKGQKTTSKKAQNRANAKAKEKLAKLETVAKQAEATKAVKNKAPEDFLTVLKKAMADKQCHTLGMLSNTKAAYAAAYNSIKHYRLNAENVLADAWAESEYIGAVDVDKLTYKNIATLDSIDKYYFSIRKMRVVMKFEITSETMADFAKLREQAEAAEKLLEEDTRNYGPSDKFRLVLDEALRIELPNLADSLKKSFVTQAKEKVKPKQDAPMDTPEGRPRKKGKVLELFRQKQAEIREAAQLAREKLLERKQAEDAKRKASKIAEAPVLTKGDK